MLLRCCCNKWTAVAVAVVATVALSVIDDRDLLGKIHVLYWLSTNKVYTAEEDRLQKIEMQKLILSSPKLQKLLGNGLMDEIRTAGGAAVILKCACTDPVPICPCPASWLTVTVAMRLCGQAQKHTRSDAADGNRQPWVL